VTRLRRRGGFFFEGGPLSAADELELIALAQGGDSEAMELLAQQYAALVQSIAGSDEDAQQEGRVGLVIAIQRFDASKGARLLTYATWWVRCRVRDWNKLNRMIPVPAGREAVWVDSLDEPLPDGGFFGDLIPDGRAGPEQLAVEAGAVRALLRELSPNQRAAIANRLNGGSDADLAADRGVTRQRIGQAAKAGAKRLKAAFESEK
jgi:RNA polymerase sigma factor (sigma-70 family)